MRHFLTVGLNGVTLAALYFIVASGFTLIFGMMRTVNLAHGSLYLFGAYLGYDVARLTGNWYLAALAGAGRNVHPGTASPVACIPVRVEGPDLWLDLG